MIVVVVIPNDRQTSSTAAAVFHIFFYYYASSLRKNVFTYYILSHCYYFIIVAVKVHTEKLRSCSGLVNCHVWLFRTVREYNIINIFLGTSCRSQKCLKGGHCRRRYGIIHLSPEKNYSPTINQTHNKYLFSSVNTYTNIVYLFTAFGLHQT